MFCFMLYTFLVNKRLWSAPLYQAEKQVVGLKQHLFFSSAKINKKIHSCEKNNPPVLNNAVPNSHTQ